MVELAVAQRVEQMAATSGEPSAVSMADLGCFDGCEVGWRVGCPVGCDVGKRVGAGDFNKAIPCEFAATPKDDEYIESDNSAVLESAVSCVQVFPPFLLTMTVPPEVAA
jgi:hypothetical protein